MHLVLERPDINLGKVSIHNNKEDLSFPIITDWARPTYLDPWVPRSSRKKSLICELAPGCSIRPTSLASRRPRAPVHRWREEGCCRNDSEYICTRTWFRSAESINLECVSSFWIYIVNRREKVHHTLLMLHQRIEPNYQPGKSRNCLSVFSPFSSLLLFPASSST